MKVDVVDLTFMSMSNSSLIDDDEIYPMLAGNATIGEMVRTFWPFTVGRRWLLACNVVLSLGLFVLIAVLPLLTGRLLETALASARAGGETDRYVAAFRDAQDITSDAIEWGEVAREDARAAVVGVRAATLAALIANSTDLLDSLFPDQRSYDETSLQANISRQFGDERSDWQNLVSLVVQDGRIERSEVEGLRDAPSLSRLERAEAFNFVVSLLALDSTAEAQRDEWRSAALTVQLLQFGGIVVAIIMLRIVTVSLALHVTVGAGRRMQDEVFRRVHDTVIVESGKLGRPSMLSRCTSYIDRVQAALLVAQTTGIPAVANLILSLALVVWIDIQIGVILAAVVLMFEVVRRVLSSRWSRLAHERLDRNTTLNDIADAAISTIPAARMSHTESFVRRRFRMQADLVSRDTVRLERFAEGFSVSAFNIGQLGVVVVIVIIGVARGDMALATAAAAVLYSRSVGDAIANIPGVVVDLHEAAPYMRRIRRVLLTPDRLAEPTRTTPQAVHGAGAITFENATYIHPDGAHGFSGLSCTCSAGWTIVASGSSASRSAVIAAAAGLDRLVEGEVRLEGLAGSTVQGGAARTLVATLGPAPDIVEGSLIDNISLADPSIDRARVEDAIVRSGLDDLRRSLPEGDRTSLGVTGHSVSPTDRIRIGVARVMASTAPIVAIDDPTPGLDRDAADDIWGRLRSSLTERVVVMATTRLDQISDQDDVLVLDKGHLVERGTRSDLLARSRVFNDLWRRMTGGGDDDLDLASIPSLGRLGTDIAQQLRSRLVAERYVEDQTIFAMGDIADRVFVIVDGSVELLIDDKRVASLRAGDHFGELTLDAAQTRTTTARARTPVVLRSLHRLAISGGAAGMLDRSPFEQRAYRWLVRHGMTTASELATALDGERTIAALETMVSDGIVLKDDNGTTVQYRLAGVNRRRSSSSSALLDGLVNAATLEQSRTSTPPAD
jgi:ABC-type multidrug transport system fused ATPase/permease subunit/CRP-like cAMP-binding protein